MSVVTNVGPAWLGAVNAKLASAAQARLKKNDRLLISPPRKQTHEASIKMMHP
jgi:hypothetical protein